MRQLEEKVLEYEGPLLTAGARLAEVDVLASFAEVSQDYRYVRPRIHAEPLLLVKGARHPLQELTVDTFVPNDIAVSAGTPEERGGGSVSVRDRKLRSGSGPQRLVPSYPLTTGITLRIFCRWPPGVPTRVAPSLSSRAPTFLASRYTSRQSVSAKGSGAGRCR